MKPLMPELAALAVLVLAALTLPATDELVAELVAELTAAAEDTLLLAATAAANVLRIPVARNSPGTVTRRNPRLSRRASFTESLVNNITGGGYYASVSVGTPGQDIDMILDTGSSDAFIVASGADLCESPRLQLIYQTSCGQTCEHFLVCFNPPARDFRGW